MHADTAFHGDDLRRVDPKFQLPRFARYLAALAGQLRPDEMHMIADFLGVPE